MSTLEECGADCPYCGEPITLLIDTSCAEQSYVEDCEVCCRPMLVNVFVGDGGRINLTVYTENE